MPVRAQSHGRTHEKFTVAVGSEYLEGKDEGVVLVHTQRVTKDIARELVGTGVDGRGVHVGAREPSSAASAHHHWDDTVVIGHQEGQDHVVRLALGALTTTRRYTGQDAQTV